MFHGVARVVEVHKAIAEIDATGSTRTHAKNRFEQLGSTGAHQTIQTKDLALADIEGDVLQVRLELGGQVLD